MKATFLTLSIQKSLQNHPISTKTTPSSTNKTSPFDHLLFILIAVRLGRMDGLLGILKIRVKRGLNLAVRDVCTSDPYVVVRMGKEKLKTRVVPKDVNPVWDEELTMSVTDPDIPIKLTVYDHDMFSKDDPMGEAEFDVKPFIESLQTDLLGLPSGTIVSRIQPCRQNCLAEESCITCFQGKIFQDVCLRLRNVECGEVELRLEWIDLPGSARSKTGL